MNDEPRCAFIGKNVDYYLDAFEAVSLRKTRWNWAAFLLGFVWMFYRRMYLYAFIIGALSFIQCMLEEVQMIPLGASIGIYIGIGVAFGTMGNAVYKMHVDKQLKMLRSSKLSDDEFVKLAAERGSPKVLAAFVGIFLFVAVFHATIYLAAALFPDSVFGA